MNLIEVQSSIRGLEVFQMCTLAQNLSETKQNESFCAILNLTSSADDEFLMEIFKVAGGYEYSNTRSRAQSYRTFDTQSTFLIVSSAPLDLHELINHISENYPRFVLLSQLVDKNIFSRLVDLVSSSS